MPVERPSSSPAPVRSRNDDPADGAPSSLRRGGEGDDVKALQTRLNGLGYDCGDADGKFGPKTEKAVKAFQKKSGLETDGVAGPKTFAKLETAQAPSASPARQPASADAQTGSRQRAAAQDQAASVQRTGTAPSRADSPPAVDVGTLTPQQLSSMKSSSDSRVRDMASTAARAQKAYADVIQNGGKVTVSSSPANGGKPVVTLVPPGFDPSKPATVHTHYHGWNATVADGKDHSAGTTKRIADIQKNDPQAVFVLPECNNAQAGSYHSDWSNVKSQAQTTRDALSDAGVDNVGKKIVSAHSAGGFALQRAMSAKADGSGVDADRLDLQDCLYGPEKQIAAWGSTPAGKKTAEVRYFHGTNDAGRDRDVARAFAGRYQKIEVRATSAHDAHNRTVADFMES